MGYKIGFDVGGTNIVCGMLDDRNQLVGTVKRPTEAQQGFEHVMNRMASMVDEIIAEYNVERARVQVIGAGIPGFIDPVRGVVLKAGNMKWVDAPVAERLGERTGIPVFIDNDVRMYVFGESTLGAGRGHNVVLGVTIGTGIAGAVYDHGSLYYGGGFMAGELGHFRIEGVEYECGCGMIGCVETIVSAPGIARLARERIVNGQSTVMAQEFSGEKMERITAADVSRAYDAGDPAAIDVMNKVGKTLGWALSFATTMMSPDVIVVGGGGANAGERILAPMREELQNKVHPMYWDKLTIRTAELLDDAGVMGSAMYGVSRLSDKQ